MFSTRVKVALVAALVAACLNSATTHAAVPAQLSYQGYLRDSTGGAFSGAVDMVFRIFDQPTDGAEIWAESHTGVDVSNGIFSVYLGSTVPLHEAVFSGSPRWIETEIDGTRQEPRRFMGTMPYAYHAAVADSVVSAPGNGSSDGAWVQAGGNIYRLTGNVGVGTSAPESALHVEGTSVFHRDDWGNPAILLRGQKSGSPNNWGEYAIVPHYQGINFHNTQSGDLMLHLGGGGAASANTYVNPSRGNFGVGLSSPTAKMHVTNRSDDPTRRLFQIDDLNSTATGGTNLVLTGSSDGLVLSSTWSALHLGAANGVDATKTLTLAPSGKVGIGTTSPNFPLTVAGVVHSTTGGFRFPDGTTQATAQAVGPEGPRGPTGATGPAGPEGPMGPQGPAAEDHWSANGAHIYKSNNGNVGIGTTLPTQLLDVRGTAAAYEVRSKSTSGSTRGEMLVHTSGSGLVEVYSPSGKINAVMSSVIETGHETGAISVMGSTIGQYEAAMYVDTANRGVVVADIKNFRVASSKLRGKEIWYASVEGPEAAAYCRGTAELVAGRCVIYVPDHFAEVTVSEGITVQLTPRSAQSQGLAVVSEGTQNGIVVQELNGGTGTYKFDYLVMGVRRGHEDYKVVRDEIEFAQ